MRKFFLFFVLFITTFCVINAQQLEVTGNGPFAISNQIPVMGIYFEAPQRSQMIYPAAKLTALQGKQITKITMFTDTGNFEGAAWNNDAYIRMGTTTQSDLESGWYTGQLMQLYHGKLIINSSNQLVIELDKPFEYFENNLLIEFDVPFTPNPQFANVNFYGNNEEAIVSRHAIGSAYSGNGTPFNFLPRMTVTYEQGDGICEPATNVQTEANGAYVDITWNAPTTKKRDILINETFETGYLPIGWTVIDADGDGYNWDADYGYGLFDGHNGGNCISSASYINGVGALSPDNYLITPLVEGATSIKFWVSAQAAEYPSDKYQVLASSTGTAIEDFAILFEEIMIGKGNSKKVEGKLRGNTRVQGTWYERSFDLPEGTKYIAFRHYDSSDNYWLNLDDVIIYGMPPEPQNYTYTITRNNIEIAAGIYETNYTDGNVHDGTHNYCVEVVYANCTSDPACAAPVVVDASDCPPATNVETSVVGSDVTVTWNSPNTNSTYIVTRNGVEIATGVTETTYTDINAPDGVHDYCVRVVYAECTSIPACAEETIVNIANCPPVTNVSATHTIDQGQSVVTVNWKDSNRRGAILLNETFDGEILPAGWTQIDADGDGNMWDVIGALGYGGEGSCVTSKSWDNVPLTPDNYLITPQVSGATIVNYWVCVQSSMYPDEHYAVMASSTGTDLNDFVTVFEETMTAKGSRIEGEKSRENSKAQGLWYERTIELPQGTRYVAFRHYNCSDAFYLNIDNITVSGGVPVGQYTYTVIRNGVEIASGVEETSYTDVDVADGTYEYCVEVVYPTCTSVPACANPIEINVSECPPATDVIATHSLEGYQDIVTISWNAPTAKTKEVLLTEDFEAGILPANWTVIDADGDGFNWDVYGLPGYNSGNCVSSASYINNVGPLTPDNYLITPLLNNAVSVNYWISSQDDMFAAEKYQVLASTTGAAIEDFTPVFEETMTAKGEKAQSTWCERTVHLPEGTKYIAFRHFDCTNQFFLNLDEITIYGGVAPEYDYTYTIMKGNINIASGVTETTYIDKDIFSGTFNYCVKVVYEDCISSPACAEPIVINSIDNEFADMFKVYPNPAKDIINVVGNITNVVMYNSIGQAVRTNLNDEQIDVSSLENGIYYLVITGSDKTQRVEKVIITK